MCSAGRGRSARRGSAVCRAFPSTNDRWGGPASGVPRADRVKKPGGTEARLECLAGAGSPGCRVGREAGASRIGRGAGRGVRARVTCCAGGPRRARSSVPLGCREPFRYPRRGRRGARGGPSRSPRRTGRRRTGGQAPPGPGIRVRAGGPGASRRAGWARDASRPGRWRWAASHPTRPASHSGHSTRPASHSGHSTRPTSRSDRSNRSACCSGRSDRRGSCSGRPPGSCGGCRCGSPTGRWGQSGRVGVRRGVGRRGRAAVRMTTRLVRRSWCRRAVWSVGSGVARGPGRTSRGSGRRRRSRPPARRHGRARAARLGHPGAEEGARPAPRCRPPATRPRGCPAGRRGSGRRLHGAAARRGRRWRPRRARGSASAVPRFWPR